MALNLWHILGISLPYEGAWLTQSLVILGSSYLDLHAVS